MNVSVYFLFNFATLFKHIFHSLKSKLVQTVDIHEGNANAIWCVSVGNSILQFHLHHTAVSYVDR